MKPGYKTSEFWVMAVSSLATLINQSGALGFTIPVEAVATIAALVVSYVLSRGVAKLNAPK